MDDAPLGLRVDTGSGRHRLGGRALGQGGRPNGWRGAGAGPGYRIDRQAPVPRGFTRHCPSARTGALVCGRNAQGPRVGAGCGLHRLGGRAHRHGVQRNGWRGVGARPGCRMDRQIPFLRLLQGGRSVLHQVGPAVGCRLRRIRRISGILQGQPTPGRRIPNRRGRRPARPSGQAQIRTTRPAGRSSIPQTPCPAAASGGRTRHPRRPHSGVGPGLARRMRQWMVSRAGTEWRSQRHASSDSMIPGPRRGWSSCILCSPRSRTRRSATRIRSMTFPRTATCRWVSCQRSNDCSTATFC